jgi:hypothetical protein
MHVLDHVEHGGGSSQPVHEIKDRLKQPQLRCCGEVHGPGLHGWSLSRDESSQFRGSFQLKIEGAGAVQPTQRLGERGERQRVAGHRHAGPVQQGHSLLLDQLADQAGLSHPGLAGDQEHAGVACGGTAHRRFQHPEAVVTPDQRCRWTSHHRLIMTGLGGARHPGIAV